ESGKYDVTVRPHPVEDADFYEQWLLSLPAEMQARCKVDAESNITSLILSCDLEISGESCTTAVESWIAGKPTIELDFDPHPIFFDKEGSSGNVTCNDPAKLPAMVGEQLANPAQQELSAVREAYLEKWCASPDGTSCEKIAQLIADAVKSKKPADWSK